MVSACPLRISTQTSIRVFKAQDLPRSTSLLSATLSSDCRSNACSYMHLPFVILYISIEWDRQNRLIMFSPTKVSVAFGAARHCTETAILLWARPIWSVFHRPMQSRSHRSMQQVRSIQKLEMGSFFPEIHACSFPSCTGAPVLSCRIIYYITP